MDSTNKYSKYNPTQFLLDEFNEIYSLDSQWEVEDVNCEIILRERIDAEDIDIALCGLVNQLGPEVQKKDLGLVLGFSLSDLPEENRYRDEAEESVLDSLISDQIVFGLLEIKTIADNDKDLICITDEGRYLLETKEKYLYWISDFNYFKYHYYSVDEEFEFHEQFISPQTLPNKKIYKGKSIYCNLSDRFDYQVAKNKLNKNFDGKYELLSITKKSYPRIINIEVVYQLLQHKSEEDYVVLVYYDNKLNERLSSIINRPENAGKCDEIIKKCQFNQLLEDESTTISSREVKRFFELWDRTELLKDTRLRWEEEELWGLFKEMFSISEWIKISELAPLNEIQNRIEEYVEFWNWPVLSDRLPDDFISSNLFNRKLNWDFEVISGRNIEFVWTLIQRVQEFNAKIPDKNKVFPDWDFLTITDSLSNDRITSILDYKYRLDFIQLSKRESSFVLECIKRINEINSTIDEPEDPYIAFWDWNFIVENWTIYDIWKNISLIGKNINWHSFLVRVLTSKIHRDFFLKDSTFKLSLRKYKHKVIPTFTLEQLNWSESLIDLLDKNGLILWHSNRSQLGFECNPAIEWTPKLLKKYKNKFETSIGKTHISKVVNENRFLYEVDDFAWDWDEISKNRKLDFTVEFLNDFSQQLNWSILSEVLSDHFVQKHIFDFEWDFEIISSKREIHFVKQLLLKEGLLERNWDWKHLTKFLDNDFITENLSLIEKKWDWSYLTREKFSKDEIIELLDTSSGYWDWGYLIEDVFTIEELEDEDFSITVAVCLNNINDDVKRKNSWNTLTKRVSPNFLAQKNFLRLKTTYFQWDWSYLSQHPRFDFTFELIERFKDKWDWSVLSRNTKLNYNLKYLNRFKDYWDWEYISEKSNFIIGRKRIGGKIKYFLNKKVIKRFAKYIHFPSLSKRTDIVIDNELIDEFSEYKWDFSILSSRSTIKLHQEFLRKFSERNWDWRVLSFRNDLIPQKGEEKKDEDHSINNIILEFRDKDWDWKHLSSRKDIRFTYRFLNETLDYDWDFQVLSRKPSLVWSKKLLRLLKDKGIDWGFLSESNAIQELDADYINSFVSYWDWPKLSTNPNFCLTKKLIKLYKEKWEFSKLTQRKEIIDNPGLIIKFVDEAWDWNFISSSNHWRFDLETLALLKDKLNWQLLSANSNIDLDTELLKKFEDKWDFFSLSKHQHLNSNTKAALNEYLRGNAKLKFLIEIDKQNSNWKGFVFHFAHLSNAAEILRMMAIKSRNKALQVSDSAGSVVNRRHTAHDFARFYFRPLTPTQFYNENLGKSPSDDWEYKEWYYYGWHSKYKFKGHYQKAANMGFPKCPVPIFFKISLKEVLDKYYEECYASNGNMQTNWARVFPIKQVLNSFNFRDVYSTINNTSDGSWRTYLNASQQEFLVKDELPLEQLESLEIICQSEIDKAALLNLIGDYKEFEDKIRVERYNLFHNQNKRFNIDFDGKTLFVETPFYGQLVTSITFKEEYKLEEISGEIFRIEKTLIEGGRSISLSFLEPPEFQVWFKDESERNWLLFQTKNFFNTERKPSRLEGVSGQVMIPDWANKELTPVEIINFLKAAHIKIKRAYESKVRHYLLERHTLLVMNQFEEYFATAELPIQKNLFRLILALHDIGKPKAFAEGNKSRQHFHTKRILKQVEL